MSFLARRRAQASFWHVDGQILACPRPQLRRFLACRRAHVILACRRAHFSMSTGTFTILHFTIFPFQPTFWYRGPLFWHVGAHFGMSTAAFTILHFTIFPSSGPSFLACWRAHFACRPAHLLFYTLLFFLSSLLFGIAGRHFDMSTGAYCMSSGTFTILHSDPPVSRSLQLLGGAVVRNELEAHCLPLQCKT